MAENRKSMKGKGADIFLGEEEKEDKSTDEEKTNKDEDKEANGGIKFDQEAEKEKAGFYLRKDLTEQLEFVWVKARSITGKKVSKSDIVNLALKKLVEEFNEDPEDNFIVNQWKS